MKRHHLFILLLIALAGCSSNSGLTSFGNRKYTKGYFFDKPGKICTITKAESAITTAPLKPEIENEKELERKQSIQAAKSPVSSIFSLNKANTNNKIVAVKSVVKSIDKIVKPDVKNLVDTPNADKPVEKKTAWGVIALIAAMLVLLILAYAILTIIVSGGYLSLFLFVYSLFALIPAAIGVVSVIIALHIHDTHHSLITSLVICIIPFVIILLLLLFP